MYAKKRFETHSDLDFPVTEEMFKQIWLERLKEDKGYGENLRNTVQKIAPNYPTVADIVETIASLLSITSDPKAIINTFTKNVQGISEHIRSYIFRKHNESRTIMIDGHFEKRELIEIILAGMREEEPLKHKLIRKFRKNKINNFIQLDKQIDIELLETKGASGAVALEQICYTSGFQSQRPQQNQQPSNPPYEPKQPANPAPKYKKLQDIPNLNWPQYWSLPTHLTRHQRFYQIIDKIFPRGTCWGYGHIRKIPYII